MKVPTVTQYKGIEFRSKTEAVYARAFDLLGWAWEYEPYIPCWPHNPDFLVGAKRNGVGVVLAVIEIKPARPSKAYLNRIQDSAAEYSLGFRCISSVLYGNPWDGGDVFSIGMKDGEWSDPCPVEWMMSYLHEAVNYRFDLESPAEL